MSAMTATTPPSAATPRAERPVMPREYGVPTATKGLMEWAAVDRRLGEARVNWIATSGPDGRPRVRPLDGLWLDGTLYVGGSPATRWARDLVANPHVSVHLDDGFDVVILEGEAELLEHGVDRPTAERLAAMSATKYPDYGITADDYGGPGPFAIRPAVAFAWKQFPKDVTRFRFPTKAEPDTGTPGARSSRTG